MAQASELASRADGRDIPAVRRRWRTAVPLELRTTVWLVCATAVVVLATTAYSPRFFQAQTFVVVAFNMAFIGTMAVGVSIVMKSGAELDLSVAMNAAASALILASLLGKGWAFPLALLVSLLFGLGVVW